MEPTETNLRFIKKRFRAGEKRFVGNSPFLKAKAGQWEVSRHLLGIYEIQGNRRIFPDARFWHNMLSAYGQPI